MALSPGEFRRTGTGHPTTVPEQLSIAVTGLAVGGLAFRALTGRMHPGLVCPLRSLTGIPCPSCGTTTSASALVDLRLADAMAANPFVPVLVLVAATVVVVAVGRRAGIIAAAERWDPPQRRRASVVAAAVAGASWLWQLARFDWF